MLSEGRALLAAGFLLLGVFAFFNNPLSPMSAKAARQSIVVRISWACGFLGIVAVLAAAARTWL
jgi:hypothetical protein